jgi:lipoprotein-anchoring transpeptidase ErfK/SrfK
MPKPVPAASKSHSHGKLKNPHQHRIEVSLQEQTVKAYDGPTLVYSFDCITGDKDHPTDPGNFRVFLKDEKHVSHKYHVKMYYALFFTHDGKAIHQYHGPAFWLVRTLKQDATNWFGSHGCVRLVEEDARKLYQWAPLHTSITVK